MDEWQAARFSHLPSIQKHVAERARAVLCSITFYSLDSLEVFNFQQFYSQNVLIHPSSLFSEVPRRDLLQRGDLCVRALLRRLVPARGGARLVPRLPRKKIYLRPGRGEERGRLQG